MNLTFVVVYHACKFMTWLYCPNKSTVQNGSVDLFKDFLRGKSERTGHATGFRIVFFLSLWSEIFSEVRIVQKLWKLLHVLYVWPNKDMSKHAIQFSGHWNLSSRSCNILRGLLRRKPMEGVSYCLNKHLTGIKPNWRCMLFFWASYLRKSLWRYSLVYRK